METNTKPATSANPTVSEISHLALDQCRVAFMAGITAHYIRMLQEDNNLPQAMNRNVLKDTLSQLERCTREIRRTSVPHVEGYLDRNMKRHKLLEMATVVDMVARVGAEERTEVFEEFIGLMIDCFDAVFYSQKHRRTMHFGKYKELFRILAEEIKLDTNNQSGRFVFTPKHELFLRTAPAPVRHQMK